MVAKKRTTIIIIIVNNNSTERQRRQQQKQQYNDNWPNNLSYTLQQQTRANQPIASNNTTQLCIVCAKSKL
uniref:Uncharacterized protein n=1 Tax=Glossina austeni TaxID=7395 RepID=A0A1A9V1N4_GLOAU